MFAGTDLEGLVFHELRHTAAALAIAHAAHPQTIKERLGHSSITVTMDTYGHLFPSADERSRKPSTPRSVTRTRPPPGLAWRK